MLEKNKALPIHLKNPLLGKTNFSLCNKNRLKEGRFTNVKTRVTCKRCLICLQKGRSKNDT